MISKPENIVYLSKIYTSYKPTINLRKYCDIKTVPDEIVNFKYNMVKIEYTFSSIFPKKVNHNLCKYNLICVPVCKVLFKLDLAL